MIDNVVKTIGEDNLLTIQEDESKFDGIVNPIVEHTLIDDILESLDISNNHVKSIIEEQRAANSTFKDWEKTLKRLDQLYPGQNFHKKFITKFNEHKEIVKQKVLNNARKHKSVELKPSEIETLVKGLTENQIASDEATGKDLDKNKHTQAVLGKLGNIVGKRVFTQLMKKQPGLIKTLISDGINIPSQVLKNMEDTKGDLTFIQSIRARSLGRDQIISELKEAPHILGEPAVHLFNRLLSVAEEPILEGLKKFLANLNQFDEKLPPHPSHSYANTRFAAFITELLSQIYQPKKPESLVLTELAAKLVEIFGPTVVGQLQKDLTKLTLITKMLLQKFAIAEEILDNLERMARKEGNSLGLVIIKSLKGRRVSLPVLEQTLADTKLVLNGKSVKEWVAEILASADNRIRVKLFNKIQEVIKEPAGYKLMEGADFENALVHKMDKVSI